MFAFFYSFCTHFSRPPRGASVLWYKAGVSLCSVFNQDFICQCCLPYTKIPALMHTCAGKREKITRSWYPIQRLKHSESRFMIWLPRTSVRAPEFFRIISLFFQGTAPTVRIQLLTTTTKSTVIGSAIFQNSDTLFACCCNGLFCALTQTLLTRTLRVVSMLLGSLRACGVCMC